MGGASFSRSRQQLLGSHDVQLHMIVLVMLSPGLGGGRNGPLRVAWLASGVLLQAPSATSAATRSHPVGMRDGRCRRTVGLPKLCRDI
jgi:hypothetical protein